MGRGALTDRIQEIAVGFLGREITTRELRLYAYVDFVMKNEQRIDPNKIETVERDVLSVLRKEGHIEGGAGGLSMTKEFYDYLQEVLWEGYVVGGAYQGVLP